MELMRIFFVFILVCSTFFFATQAYAQVDLCPDPEGNFANLCDLKAENTGTIVSNILQILLVLAVVLSIIFMLWGGVKWVTAGGDKGSIDGARSTIIAAITGLVLAFLAFFIFNLILFLFGVDSGGFEIPKLTQP